MSSGSSAATPVVPHDVPDTPVAPSTRTLRRLRTVRWGDLAWYACLALLALWAVGYVRWPMSVDQGMLSWVGDTIRAGGMPYRDAWEIRGPLPFFLYALVQSVFGRNEWGLRLFDLFVLGGGAMLIARMARPSGRVAVRVAVALYLLWYASLGFHDTAQSDAWSGVLLAGAAALLVSRATAPGLLAFAGSGALVGAAVLCKPTYGIALLVPAAYAIAGGRRGLPAILTAGLATAAGFAAVVGAAVAYFASRGALDALLDVHLLFTIRVYGQVDGLPWLNIAQTTIRHLTADRFGLALPLALVGLAVAWRNRRPDAAALGAWLFAAVFTVAFQGKFWTYHWHPVYAPLLLLVGIGAAAASDWMRAAPGGAVPAGPGRLLPLALLAVLFAAAALEPVMHVYRWALLPRARMEEVEFRAHARPDGAFAQVMAYLAANSQRGDGVQIWGGHPGMNFLLDRRPPARFGYVAPLTEIPDGDFRRRYRAEYLAAFHRSPPAYIVALDPEFCRAQPTREERFAMGDIERLMDCLSGMPEVQPLVHDGGYGTVFRTGNMVVLRRGAAADSGAAVTPGGATPPRR